MGALGLTMLDRYSKDFKAIEKYVNDTKDTFDNASRLLNIWSVSSSKIEGKIPNHKLLFSCAIIPSLLKNGLKFSPYSYGRLGKGLYFSCNQNKAIASMIPGKLHDILIGILLLSEVALGKEHTTNTDCPQTEEPPKDSTQSSAWVELHLKKFVDAKFEDFTAQVPNGKPKPQINLGTSSFAQNEYSIPTEKQQVIRFLVAFSYEEEEELQPRIVKPTETGTNESTKKDSMNDDDDDDNGSY